MMKNLPLTVWKVRRVKGKRTWINWFPRDVLEFSTDYVTILGDEHLLGTFVILGEKWEWAE